MAESQARDMALGGELSRAIANSTPPSKALGLLVRAMKQSAFNRPDGNTLPGGFSSNETSALYLAERVLGRNGVKPRYEPGPVPGAMF